MQAMKADHPDNFHVKSRNRLSVTGSKALGLPNHSLLQVRQGRGYGKGAEQEVLQATNQTVDID
jgi:hypothetical protein